MRLAPLTADHILAGLASSSYSARHASIFPSWHGLQFAVLLFGRPCNGGKSEHKTETIGQIIGRSGLDETLVKHWWFSVLLCFEDWTQLPGKAKGQKEQLSEQIRKFSSLCWNPSQVATQHLAESIKKTQVLFISFHTSSVISSDMGLGHSMDLAAFDMVACSFQSHHKSFQILRAGGCTSLKGPGVNFGKRILNFRLKNHSTKDSQIAKHWRFILQQEQCVWYFELSRSFILYLSLFNTILLACFFKNGIDRGWPLPGVMKRLAKKVHHPWSMLAKVLLQDFPIRRYPAFWNTSLQSSVRISSGPTALRIWWSEADLWMPKHPAIPFAPHLHFPFFSWLVLILPDIHCNIKTHSKESCETCPGGYW